MTTINVNIEAMRDICRKTKLLLDYISPFVQAGITTNQLNEMCENYTVKILGCESAPLGYKGYPKSICTSKNNVVCHGIPDDIPLKEGDIINVDVTLKKMYDGVYHYGDSSKMYMIGKVHPRHRYLCEVTYNCLMAAIKVIKPNTPINKIGEVIEKYARSAGFSVVEDFAGHGIGTEFHSEPTILHCKNNDTRLLKSGMTFTIEPMLNEKSRKSKLLEDGWTVMTKDGGYSAQWEHTILVTDDGYEVLTLGDKYET